MRLLKIILLGLLITAAIDIPYFFIKHKMIPVPGILIAYTIALVFFIFKYTKAKYSGSKAEAAAQTITQLINKKQEFAIIFRPFGNDGKVLNPLKGSIFENMFKHLFTHDLTLEETIYNQVKLKDNIETFSIIDPRKQLLPAKPKYVFCKDNEWQYAVFNFIVRAKYIFVIIPEGQFLRESLIWEVKKIVQLGVLDRMIFLIAPTTEAKQKELIQNIKKELYFLPQIEDIPENMVAYWTHDYEEPRCYQAIKLKEKDVKQYHHFHVKEFEQPIKRFLNEVNANLSNMSFFNRYIACNTEFSEYDSYNSDTLPLFLKQVIS